MHTKHQESIKTVIESSHNFVQNVYVLAFLRICCYASEVLSKPPSTSNLRVGTGLVEPSLIAHWCGSIGYTEDSHIIGSSSQKPADLDLRF